MESYIVKNDTATTILVPLGDGIFFDVAPGETVHFERYADASPTSSRRL